MRADKSGYLNIMAAALMSLGLAPAAQAQAQAAAPEPAVAPQANVEQRAADVASFFRDEIGASEIFSEAFLNAVPAAQLAAVVKQTTEQFGAPIGVERVVATTPNAGTMSLRFERAIISGPLALDADGKIANLLLNDIAPVDDTPAKILGELQALPGVTNAWFGPLDGGEPLMARNAELPLALGSTFKIYVLSALSHAVARGEHDWDDVITLGYRSFPSGVTQDWPDDAPVTVQTLATLMIQISDNTATDRLITLLGREAIETEIAASNSHAGLNSPLLTTRELFVLKSESALRQSWLDGDEATRRAMLSNLADREVSLQSVTSALGGNPVDIDKLEWFASPADLRALLQRLTAPDHAMARAILASNPSVSAAAKKAWPYVGFKGGSEPGVLNLTWLLQDKGGRWHMLTLGWNDPAAPIDQKKLELLSVRMLAIADAPLASSPAAP